MGTPGGADRFRDPIVLGGELASALAAEERRLSAKPPPSPIAGVRYAADEATLWRWREARPDSIVAAFSAGYSSLDPADRSKVRASLSMDDCYTLVTFARRSALSALRGGDAGRVATAFRTLAAVTLERVDWRDVWVAAGLLTYAGQRLGLDMAAVGRDAAALGPDDLEEVFAAVTDGPIDLAEACGYREVPGPLFYADDGERFEPAADLLGMAGTVAHLLDGDELYQVTDITAGAELPDVWLGGDEHDAPDDVARHAARATRRLTGCVDVHAEPRTSTGHSTGHSSGHFLLAFVAEAADETDAAAIAAAAQAHPLAGASQLGIACGRLCAVIVARATVQDAESIEDPVTLARFRTPVEAALTSR